LISDLLDEQGQLLSYQAFKAKYKCKTNFLNYYQVRSAVPDSLLAKIKNNNLELLSKSIFLQNHSIFDLDSSTKVNFETAKVKDFYWLLNKQVNNSPHTGPTKWSKSMPICAKQTMAESGDDMDNKMAIGKLEEGRGIAGPSTQYQAVYSDNDFFDLRKQVVNRAYFKDFNFNPCQLRQPATDIVTLYTITFSLLQSYSRLT